MTEHYWGYVTERDGSTVVEHPPWRVWRGHDAKLECDVDAVYGAEFAPALAGKPSSCFLADGSEITVREGVKSKSSA